MKDRVQRQRFEFKYVVSDQVALGVRDFVSSYMEPDRFGVTRPNLSYPVHTLYLDSPDFALYRATINGERNRYKLRIRFYEEGDAAPVFLEIKHRVNNVIRKKRARVTRNAAREVHNGQIPDPGGLLDTSPEALESLQSFILHVSQLGARPQTHVRYLREAWTAGRSNNLRVTMDRAVMGERQQELAFRRWMERPVRVFGDQVILELKFTDRFPGWMRELVQVFGLRQRSAAKYVDGVYRMGERGLMTAYL
jgi:hypothetical protein